MKLFGCCHSLDDAKFIEANALESAKRKEKCSILIAGKAAENYLKTFKSEYADITSLADILGKELTEVEDKKATAADLEKIKDYLKKINPTHALIGTPSKLNAEIPFQIAKILSPSITKGVIYNGYLFAEATHCFNTILKSEGEDSLLAKWLFAVTLEKAAKAAKEMATFSINIAHVGHLSIDALTDEKIDTQKIETTRATLGIKSQKTPFLFISGAKDIKEDTAVLAGFLELIDKSREEYGKIEIRMGLHPGNSNLSNNYLEQLIKCVEQYDKAKTCFKIIMTKKLKDDKKLTLTSPFIIEAEVSGDAAAEAGNGVACYYPATLPTVAALRGQPAYSQIKGSYLPDETQRFSSPKSLDVFMGQVANLKKLGLITKKELNLKDQTTVEAIQNYLYS